MFVAKTKLELTEKLKEWAGESIGFVPTMGALHDGHASLVSRSVEDCDVSVVSIFVNPKQFNNVSDLENYPNTLSQDLILLESLGCHLVFTPSKEEVYDGFEGVSLDIGSLAEVMEGEFRPGHFKGVVDVVYRLFDLINPQKAFFGLKDFQQVSVLKFMVNHFELPVELVACPTIREENGLAKSSRNLRLSDDEKISAKIIFKAMKLAKEWMRFYTISETKDKIVQLIEEKGLKIEYVSIVDPNTLQDKTSWNDASHVCIVAHCGDVRLIDNLSLN